jgi:hypothetical protein
MVVRWVAAWILEAVQGFRRLKGHKAMPQLVAALRARDQHLGIADVMESVAMSIESAARFQQTTEDQRQEHDECR